MKRSIFFKLALMGFVISTKAFGSQCPELTRSILSQKSLEGKSLEVCWEGRGFLLLEEGNSQRRFPPIALNYNENLLLALKSKITPEDLEKFKGTHQVLMREYLEGVGDRASTAMTGSVVSLVDLINQGDFMKQENCDPKMFSFSFSEGFESLVRCVVKTSSLPDEVLKKVRTENFPSGQIPMSVLLADLPDTEILMRSRVHSNADGSPREIDPRKGVPLESYLMYDLIIKLPGGEFSAVGRCYDWEERMLSLEGPEIKVGNTFIPEGDDDPFSATLTDFWRIPFSVNLEDTTVRNNRGERVPAVDVGINAGLLYREQYRGGGSIEIGPNISHPFLQGISGPGDVLNTDRLNLDYRDVTIQIGGQIKF